MLIDAMLSKFPHTATCKNINFLEDGTQNFCEEFTERVLWQPLDSNDAIQGEGFLVNKSKMYAKHDTEIKKGARIEIFGKMYNVTGVEDYSRESRLRHVKFILTEVKNVSDDNS